MPHRPGTDTDEMTNGIPNTALLCRLCVAPDPQDSAAHHLKIVKERGLELLRVHLTEQYVTLRDAGKKRQDSVENAMARAATIVEQYPAWPILRPARLCPGGKPAST